MDEIRVEILSVGRLVARWRVASRTVRRLVDDGLLRQVRLGGRVGFFWADVWACEGGQPPDGEVEAYRAPLLTPEDVATLCPLAPSTLKTYARRGKVPHRRVGAQTRFVPAEIDRWLASFQDCARPENGYGGKNGTIRPEKRDGA